MDNKEWLDEASKGVDAVLDKPADHSFVSFFQAAILKRRGEMPPKQRI